MKRLLLLVFIASIFTSIETLHAQTAPAKVWDKTIGGAQDDRLTSILQTSDGGYILGGETNSGLSGDKSQASQGLNDYWIVKLDPNGNKVWDKAIGGSGGEILYSVQQTSDGGFILGGASASPISGDKSQASKGTADYWVVKLDASGNKVWDKTIGGTTEDYLISVRQTSDGGYILGGFSNSPVSGDKSEPNRGIAVYNDYWVVKLDATGNKQWDKTFGGTRDDKLMTLEETPNGGYILGGYSDSGISGNKSQTSKGVFDYWVIKIDANGNKVWDKTIGGSQDDQLFSLALTTNGGYILCGKSDSPLSGDKSEYTRGYSDYWVVKLDLSGNKIWDKRFGGNWEDEPFSIKQTLDGGFILGGRSFSDGTGDKTENNKGTGSTSDIWVLKLDATGNKLWDKSLGGNGDDLLYSLQQTSDGWFILGGYSKSNANGDKSQPSKGGEDFWPIKLGPNCAALTANLFSPCSTGNITIDVNIVGLLAVAAGTPSWTLTYTVNGVAQTVSGTTNTYTLSSNATPGTVYSLVSITSGTCTTNLSNSLTAQAIPAAPVVTSGNKCGTGSVTLSATGAPVGGSYVWYAANTGGTALQANSTGTFTTPNLSITTTYYVAAANIAGCEGPRSPVIATITTLSANAGAYETICINAGPVQLAGFSPAGGTWSGSGVSTSGIFTPDISLVGYNTLTYTVSQNGCTSSATKQLTVLPPIPQPTINLISPDTLVSSVAGTNYIWKFNNTTLPNTTRKLKAIASGNYNVQVKDGYNCSSAFSQDYAFTISGLKESESAGVKLYPNPTNGIVNLEFANSINSEVKVYNALGQCILTKIVSKQEKETTLDLATVAKGIYTIQILGEKQSLIKKIVLE